MLTVTPTAAEVVRRLVAQAPVSDDGGIRISPGETTPAGTALQVTVVDHAEPADPSVGESGAHVYLDPTVAEFLDDKVLDVDLSEGRPSFAIREQAGFDPRNDSRPDS